MTGAIPQDRAEFNWEAPVTSTTEAGNKILSGTVTIGTRKFNVTIGYSEETLRQTYNMPDANPDEFVQTIRAIVESLHAEDIIQLSGSKITTSEQPAAAKVLHNGREYTLPALAEDPSENLRKLGQIAERVVQAFSASGVLNFRGRSQPPAPPSAVNIHVEPVEEDETSSSEVPQTPPPSPKGKEEAENDGDEEISDDEEEESIEEDVRATFSPPRDEFVEPPALPSTQPLEAELQRHLEKALKEKDAFSALLNAYKSLTQIRKVADAENYRRMEKQFKTCVAERIKFTSSEESARNDFKIDSWKARLRIKATALTIAQKEILLGLADPQRLSSPDSKNIINNILKRKPAVSQKLGELLTLRSELLEPGTL